MQYKCLVLLLWKVVGTCNRSWTKSFSKSQCKHTTHYRSYEIFTVARDHHCNLFVHTVLRERRSYALGPSTSFEAWTYTCKINDSHCYSGKLLGRAIDRGLRAFPNPRANTQNITGAMKYPLSHGASLQSFRARRRSEKKKLCLGPVDVV